MIRAFITEIIKYDRSIFSYLAVLRALTVKETHRVLDKAFLAGFTKLILMRLEVCPQSFVILRTASRTADRIYVKLNIF